MCLLFVCFLPICSSGTLESLEGTYVSDLLHHRCRHSAWRALLCWWCLSLQGQSLPCGLSVLATQAQFREKIRDIQLIQLHNYIESNSFKTPQMRQETMLLTTSCSFAPVPLADSIRPVYILALVSRKHGWKQIVALCIYIYICTYILYCLVKGLFNYHPTNLSNL